MGTLFFFPWLRLNREITVGNFSLVRYSRGESPAGPGTEEQAIIDDVLNPYLEGPGEPITHATLLGSNKRGLFDELNDEERMEAFVFSELLSLAGIAHREYFSQLGQYCNRDHFRLIGQKFDRPGGSLFTLRRRDGATRQFWPKGDYEVYKPEHVLLTTLAKLDEPLLESLLSAQGLPIWTDLYESILNFNLANTDSAAITEHTEVVLLVSAFERLLKCDHGKEDELADKFSQVLVPSSEIAPNTCARLSVGQTLDRFRKSGSVRDMWIRDFFRLRGNMAHGKITPRSPQVWLTPVHLLLGSYVFPLLVKTMLQQEKIYQMGENDQFDIDVFEPLASEDLFNSNHKIGDEYFWNKVIDEKKGERRVKNAIKFWESIMPDENPDSSSLPKGT
jgi:hypothetical protein